MKILYPPTRLDSLVVDELYGVKVAHPYSLVEHPEKTCTSLKETELWETDQSKTFRKVNFFTHVEREEYRIIDTIAASYDVQCTNLINDDNSFHFMKNFCLYTT